MSLQVFDRMPLLDRVRPRALIACLAILTVGFACLPVFNRGLGLYAVGAAAYCLVVVVAESNTRLALGLVLVCYTLPVLSTDALALPAEARLGAIPFVFLLVSRAAWRPACTPSRAAVRVHRLLGGLALLAMISAFWSPSPAATTEAAVGVAISWLIVRAASRLFTPREISDLLWPLLAILVLLSTFVAVSGLFPAGGDTAGIFANPNSLGLMCALTLPFCLERGRAGAVVGLGALWLIFESASRASALATVAGLLYGVFLLRQPRVRMVVWFFGLVLAWLLVNSLLSEGIGETASSSMFVTVDTRSEFWQAGIDAARSRPLTGIGFGAGTVAFDGASSYIAIVAALGVSGLVVVVLLVPLVIWPTLRVRRTTVFGVVVVGGLVNAFFEAWLFSGGTVLMVLYWLVVGACLQETVESAADRAIPDRAAHSAADAGARRALAPVAERSDQGALLSRG
ncbi:O-antigen ligase [Parafrankia sp. BMG5.11]|uniref:O-antigen ligase family protein n=1 Tax=Parafrankia sp. BMG5.11 TaxID=222540 RepID=UPI001404E8F1|nr:O-antigen ligase family protein [Parafrankia sp. BMG5.11]